MNFELNEWLAYSEKVAKNFARSFFAGDWVERWNDIYQELAIELITKEDKLTEAFLKMDKPDSYTRVILRNRATSYCMTEKNAFFVQTDIYDYQTGDVKVMLEQFFGGKKDGMFVPDDAKSMHGDDDLAIFGDIARVVDELSDSDLEVLESYFHEAEVKDTAERQRFNRVVRKVTNALNERKRKETREYEGPGTREVISNRKAMAKTKNTYNMKEKDFA